MRRYLIAGLMAVGQAQAGGFGAGAAQGYVDAQPGIMVQNCVRAAGNDARLQAGCIAALNQGASAYRDSGVEAILQDCRPGMSVTVQAIWVGTYWYAGRTFQRAFEDGCPESVRVR